MDRYFGSVENLASSSSLTTPRFSRLAAASVENLHRLDWGLSEFPAGGAAACLSGSTTDIAQRTATPSRYVSRYEVQTVNHNELTSLMSPANYPPAPAWTDYKRSVTIGGAAYEELSYQFLSKRRKLTIHRRVARDDGGMRRRRFQRTVEEIQENSVKNLKVYGVVSSVRSVC
jgi:hypothetical protein